jgi:UDP-N-acetylglucosamine--dolichyl-phosphate N-acetylglucosaminephosphotransferase
VARDSNAQTLSFTAIAFPFLLLCIMSTTLGQTEVYSLLALTLACFGILANTFHGDGEPLVASIAFSGLAFSFCYALVRWLGDAFMRRGFKGRDLCKVKKTEM